MLNGWTVLEVLKITFFWQYFSKGIKQAVVEVLPVTLLAQVISCYPASHHLVVYLPSSLALFTLCLLSNFDCWLRKALFSLSHPSWTPKQPPLEVALYWTSFFSCSRTLSTYLPSLKMFSFSLLLKKNFFPLISLVLVIVAFTALNLAAPIPTNSKAAIKNNRASASATTTSVGGRK